MRVIECISKYTSRLHRVMQWRESRSKRLCLHKPSRTGLWWKHNWDMLGIRGCWENGMSWDTFLHLVDELGPHIWPDPRSPNRRALSASKKLPLVKFVGSLLYTDRFSPGTPVSPLLKNQHLTGLDLCELLIYVYSVTNQCPSARTSRH